MPVIVVGDVTVPDVTGLQLAAARAALNAVYLTDSTSLVRTFAYDIGIVISQSPAGGATLDPNIPVALSACSRGSTNRRTIKDLDLTKPNTPTGLAGVAVAETLINLSWNAATDPQGAASEADTGIANYRIYRNGAFLVSLPNTSVQITGLTAYTFYAFQVSSIDVAGNESYLSSAINVRTLDTTSPSVPTVAATQTGSTTISVALTVPSTDSGSGV
jgi:hypothetical protein